MPQEPIKVIVVPPPMNAATWIFLAIILAVLIASLARYIYLVRKLQKERRKRRNNLWK